MKKIFFSALMLFSIPLIHSCGPSDDDPVVETCNTSDSDFNKVYQYAKTQGNLVESVTFDTEVHQYTFKLSEARKICKIGYQSQPNIANTPYLIEIREGTNVIYSGSHVFSSTATSYVTPNTEISLQANTNYTVRRVQTNWNGNIGNTIGRLIKKSDGTDIVLPKTFGIMTIYHTSFYQNGGPLNLKGIPFIDLVFKP